MKLVVCGFINRLNCVKIMENNGENYLRGFTTG